MDAQALLDEFLGTEHGRNAVNALTGQGLAPDQVSQVLQEAAGAAHAHVNDQGSGLLGDHMGRNVFAAFAAGLVKGDGFFGSIKDGLEGGIGGRLTESLAGKVGLDPSMTSGIVAAVTPYLTGFLSKKLGT